MHLAPRNGRFAAVFWLPCLALLFMCGQKTFPGEINWPAEREFWAFKMPERHALPLVKNVSWPARPIDFFILARLEQAKLSPSPQASKRELLRRLTFDLTGLPPSQDDAAAFLSDSAPDACARLVERLIDSRAFGEHLASLWLPLARYAEDQAHQVGDDTKFFYPNAYKYRAWVIDAFNHDLPYDRFLKFQLAADKYSETNHLAALGFLGLGPKYYNRNRLDVMADEWEDRVDTVGRAMLGLTVACARCHDHKFDPITMSDYYGLAGVFASTKMVNKTPEGTEEKKDTSADKMNPATLHMVEDGAVTNLNVFIRGNPERKGELVERRFLRILCGSDPKPFCGGSGRRELAEAIASTKNPLAARVFVNRVWGAFFGKPLVSTPSNFGHSGQPPSHPALLDDLSVRFEENGWSVKWLVRELVMSSAYQQSSRHSGPGVQADPENRLLWRMNRKRLSIEQWRDAVLFASNELSSEGGKSMELDDPQNFRRTVYGRVSRLKLNDTLMQFDYPDANVHAEKRAITTTPIQKLFLLNSPFILARASAFAQRLNGSTCTNKIRCACNMLFLRDPETREMEAARDFLSARAEGVNRLDEFAQLLFASNEFLYVE